ncbi:MAG TPA: sulfatase-like hydrolase/transferase [Myxococcota bacterium]|nr:sulfatase-like hydrolase/transferase [Myxococcota bacterium]
MGVLAFRWLPITLLSLASCTERASDSRVATPFRAEGGTIRLVDLFSSETVQNRLPPQPAPPRTEWRFDAAAEAVPAFEATSGVVDLRVREGRLSGRGRDPGAVLRLERPTPIPPGDFVHAVELRMRASAGANVRITFRGAESPDLAEVLEEPREFWSSSPLVPGPELRTYTLRGTSVIRSEDVRHAFLAPSDAADASFEIESLRVVFEKEYLAGIPSGPGWHGLSEIYRETLVARAPETLRFEMRPASRAWLDLGVGTVEDAPVSFRVAVRSGDKETLALERTLTTPRRWEPASVDLSRFAGESLSLSLSLASPQPGAIGFWGAPVVRSAPVGDAIEPGRLQGVILIQADTLRRDHLDAYGYARETAPVLRGMAAEGALFEDCIAQGTWTKVSSPSILLSLYPSSHGIVNFGDRLPASATTLAEIFRDAGFATLSLSSVFFTGKLTNLQQGFEELHESTSLPDLATSKTARVYVDRLLPWLEAHREAPFFVFLHLFDPHDPYRPVRPYDSLFGDAAGKEVHERQASEVRKFIANPLLRAFGMPTRAELVEAGFDPDVYVGHDRDWYDGSIRAMDVEIGRLLERLRWLGLAERTLVVFTSDHGEEFLEHGRTFHGQSVYGELTRVPLVVWGPGRVPAGRAIGETVQSIDILPTLLELAGLAPPAGIQGQSLVPLLRPDERDPGATPILAARPAISEKRDEADPNSPTQFGRTSTAIVLDGWKLVHNTERSDGAPEYELFDARGDPLDRTDLAAQHPERVAKLAAALAEWRTRVAEVRLEIDAAGAEDLGPEELERLRSLGYVQ